MKHLLFISLMILGISCGSAEEKTPETSTADIPESSKTEEASAEQTTTLATPSLIVNIDNLRLRNVAGERGEEVARLAEGTVLQDLGEVSDFTTRVQLRGIWFDEPWLKVRTKAGQEGWIYAGAIRFDVNSPAELTQMLLQKRLQTTFGKGIANEIQQYHKAFRKAKTSIEFAAVHERGLALRDTINYILEDRITVGENYDQAPDLFWINESLSGYVTQLVAEGTIYTLFQDYQVLGQKAIQTSGEEDDAFVELNYLIFAQDSIEYYFPSWFIQTWDYGGHSLLGQGKHLAILQNMEQFTGSTKLFNAEVFRLRNQLVDDIVLSGNEDTSVNGFWEPQDKILKELDAIIAAKFSILTSDQQTALETTRSILANAKENKILINMRAG